MDSHADVRNNAERSCVLDPVSPLVTLCQAVVQYHNQDIDWQSSIKIKSRSITTRVPPSCWLWSYTLPIGVGKRGWLSNYQSVRHSMYLFWSLKNLKGKVRKFAVFSQVPLSPDTAGPSMKLFSHVGEKHTIPDGGGDFPLLKCCWGCNYKLGLIWTCFWDELRSRDKIPHTVGHVICGSSPLCQLGEGGPQLPRRFLLKECLTLILWIQHFVGEF